MKDARTPTRRHRNTPPSWALVDSLTEARRQCESHIEKLEDDIEKLRSAIQTQIDVNPRGTVPALSYALTETKP